MTKKEIKKEIEKIDKIIESAEIEFDLILEKLFNNKININFSSCIGPCILNYYLRNGSYGSNEIESLYKVNNKIYVKFSEDNIDDIDIDCFQIEDKLLILYFIQNLTEYKQF